MILNQNKAFTLVESLITIFIIIALTLIIIPNYNSLRKQLALQRSAFKLSQDIRRVQEMAMSAKEFGGEIPGGGYGISLLSGASYVIFVDQDSDGKYDDPSERVEDDVFLENGIEIESIDPVQLQTIIFSPPDPEVFFMNSGGEAIINVDEIMVKIIISGDVSKNMEITINRAGLIDIE